MMVILLTPVTLVTLSHPGRPAHLVHPVHPDHNGSPKPSFGISKNAGQFYVTF